MALLWLGVVLSGGCGQGLTGHASVAQVASAVRAHDGPDDAEVARLREAGPAGLDALLAVYDAEARETGPSRATRLARLRVALDRVARQKDAYASRLYWHTDLERAKSAAQQSGKPILSLRLLGNLDDDLSCANSRFFRTALYPDAAVSRLLRERFILYWSPERPAPVITIDFGDGRKVVRTVTGNSLHYVLDAKGRAVDAIPGLYGPAAFHRVLEGALAIATSTASLEGDARAAALVAYHKAALAELRANWTKELVANGSSPEVAAATPLPKPAVGDGLTPSALSAQPVAMGKAFVERPMLGAFLGPKPKALVIPASDASLWSQIARRHQDDAVLDDASRAAMAAKSPLDWSATPKPLDRGALSTLVSSFEAVMSEDSVRNEFTLHAAIHDWFVREPSLGLDALNKRVYSTLFLTPASDPWLGLVPPLVFSGLENDGLVAPRP
jgi:hypothetical protein